VGCCSFGFCLVYPDMAEGKKCLKF
jgi:hypothetical protein